MEGGTSTAKKRGPLVSHVSLDKVDDGRKAHTTRPCLTFYQCSGRPGFVFLPKGGCNPTRATPLQAPSNGSLFFLRGLRKSQHRRASADQCAAALSQGIWPCVFLAGASSLRRLGAFGPRRNPGPTRAPSSISSQARRGAGKTCSCARKAHAKDADPAIDNMWPLLHISRLVQMPHVRASWVSRFNQWRPQTQNKGCPVGFPLPRKGCLQKDQPIVRLRRRDLPPAQREQCREVSTVCCAGPVIKEADRRKQEEMNSRFAQKRLAGSQVPSQLAP